MPLFFQNYDSPGPGVPKGEPKKPGIIRYFIVIGRHFWDLVFLNILYFVLSLPAIVIYMFLGVYFFGALPGDLKLVLPAILGFAMPALLGSGPARAGISSVLRNYSAEEPAFLWSDFKEYTKKYFLKGLLIFLFDLVFVCIIYADILFYVNLTINTGQGFMSMIAVYVAIFIFLIYIIMHPFIYMQLVTFDAPLKTACKNAFLLTAVRFPQNLGCLIAAMAIGYFIFELILSWNPALFLLFIVFFSLICLLLDMNSFSVIKKYLIKEAK